MSKHCNGRWPSALLTLLTLVLPAGAMAAATTTVPSAPFQIAAANSIGNTINSLNLTTGTSPNSALVNGGTTALNTDGARHGSFNAMVWAPNAHTGTLDLIASDLIKKQIVRYSGPNYGVSTVVYSWATSEDDRGPEHPTAMALDASGNLFLICPAIADDGASLWVLPYLLTTGNYGSPILIDQTFGKVKTTGLADLVVAGTAATAGGTAVPAWKAGDLLVLVGDSYDPRVLVYTQAAIRGALTSRHAVSGPNSTLVTLAKFRAKNALPIGMDIWPADATHGVSLLFSTLDGRVLRFDSATGAFVADFATGLGANPQRIRVGTYLDVPYAFIAQTLTANGGEIRQYGAPPPGGTNTAPLATITRNLLAPQALAVTSSGSSPVAQCEAPNTCSPIGPQLTLQISGPGIANNPALQNAQILETSCTIANDPRVHYVGGVWTCNGGTLDVANFCPGFPHTVLPPFLCGHSGASGAALVVLEGTAIAVDQNANNAFFQYGLDATVPLPGPNDLSCPVSPMVFPNLPLIAWAPRSDLPTVEGSIVEDAVTPFFIDSTSFCDKSAVNIKGGSMISYGLALNAAPSGLGSGPGAGLPGFATAKFTNLIATIQAATTISPTVSATLQQYVVQAQTYFNGELTAGTANGYSCAANTLAAADAYARANYTGFAAGTPPSGNYNPLGEIDGRLSNLYLTIDGYFLNEVVNTTWPATNVPPCVTLTASPTTVSSGGAATLTWGPATPTYPLIAPPTSCTVFGSDGTLLSAPFTAGGSGAVSTGPLNNAGTYTASLECTAAGSTAQGLASATVTVSAAPALQSVQVSPTTDSLPPGAAVPFHATAHFSGGGFLDVTSAATWMSSNPTAVVVGSNGSVACPSNGLGGSATVTATYSGVSGTASVTCTAPALTTLTLSPVPPSIELGSSFALVATANYDDGATQTVTPLAVWTSSNAAVATVSSSGVVTPLAVGATTITATYLGAVSANAAVNVTDYSVTATQATLTTYPGGTVNYALQIAALGAFSDSVTVVSCDVAPAIASYAFAPSSVTAGGALALQLTVPTTATTPDLAPFSCTLTSAGGDVHTVALQINVVQPPGVITSFTAPGLTLVGSSNAYTNTYSEPSSPGGNSATLAWTTSNVVANSCALSDPNDLSTPGGLSVTGLPATDAGYAVLPPLAVTAVVPTVYTLTCLGADGNTVSGTVTIDLQPPTYTVGGTVTGLAAGVHVAVTDNGSDTLNLSAAGPFTFPVTLVSGASYSVTAASQTAGVVCTVQNGSGAIAGAAITGVVVVCGDSAPNLNNPGGLAFNASGNLYAASAGSGQVLAFTPGGYGYPDYGQLVLAPGQTLSAGLTTPVAIAFDPTPSGPTAGNLYVGDNGGTNANVSVVAYSPAGAELGAPYIGGLLSVSGLAVDPNGAILVADNQSNAIQILGYSAGLQAKATLTADEFSTPFQSVTALAYNNGYTAGGGLDGEVALAIGGNSSLTFYYYPYFDQTGPLGPPPPGGSLGSVSPIPTGTSGPTGIAFDRTGQIVYVSNSSGAPLSAYQSSTDASGATTFAPISGFALVGSPTAPTPAGVAVDATGNLYVADAAHNLIDVYNPAGVFQYAIGNLTLQAYPHYATGGVATTSANLTWSAPGLPSSASCTLSSSDGAYSGTPVASSQGYNGYLVTPAISTAPVTYTLSCSAPGYSPQSASIQVPSVSLVPSYINNVSPSIGGAAPTTAPKGTSYQYQLYAVGVTSAGSCVFNAPPVLSNDPVPPTYASIGYYFPNTAGPYTVTYSCNTGGATPIQTNTASWTINLY
jgi:hypothetical protein